MGPILYPEAEAFSREVGIPAKVLIRAFEIEREYRDRILRETDPAARRRMYAEVCARTHPLYRVARDRKSEIAAKLPIVNLFRRQLVGRSILDVGCGTGAFLHCVAERLEHKRLVGIDVDPDTIAPDHPDVTFLPLDITGFRFEETFDVVFSDNVLEHIAPADLPGHLKSVRNALKRGGQLILITPNRLFGPADITQVIDRRRANRIPAAGMHLFESTYSELIPLLGRAGFTAFWSIVQIPGLLYHLPLLSIRPKIYLEIENNPKLLELMHRCCFRGKCRLKFMVVLICRKSESGRWPD